MFWRKEYCDRDTCYALKELGYPWRPIQMEIASSAPKYYDLPREHPDWYLCNAYYAFTIHEAHTWLRKEYNYHIELHQVDNAWEVSVVDTYTSQCKHHEIDYCSYEDALLKGIRSCITILKTQ